MREPDIHLLLTPTKELNALEIALEEVQDTGGMVIARVYGRPISDLSLWAKQMASLVLEWGEEGKLRVDKDRHGNLGEYYTGLIPILPSRRGIPASPQKILY